MFYRGAFAFDDHWVWLLHYFFPRVATPIRRLSCPRFMLFQVAYMYPFFYFQVDSLGHGLSASFAFYSVRRLFSHCEPIGLTIDHAGCHHQRGQFRWSVFGWYLAPISRGHRSHHRHDRRVRHLDDRYDLARISGECGSTWGAVWAVFGNEWALHLCAPTSVILSPRPLQISQ